MTSELFKQGIYIHSTGGEMRKFKAFLKIHRYLLSDPIINLYALRNTVVFYISSQ